MSANISEESTNTISYHEEGGSKYLLKVGTHLSNCMASHLKDHNFKTELILGTNSEDDKNHIKHYKGMLMENTPICDSATSVLLRSHKGLKGSPSSRSLSPCLKNSSSNNIVQW
jgi:hypothetical protein